MLDDPLSRRFRNCIMNEDPNSRQTNASTRPDKAGLEYFNSMQIFNISNSSNQNCIDYE